MDCKSGYFGKFCNETCPPGRFGYRCGGRCFPECTDEYCNSVSGCPFIIKSTTKRTIVPAVSDGVNSPRKTEKIYTSAEENFQRLESTSSISIFSKTNTMHQFFSKETPSQRNEINTNYLLGGAGAIIFMLLFIIMIQTSRKSKSAKKSLLQNKINEQNKRNENRSLHETPKSHNQKYLTIASSKKSSHCYRYMDPVYHEIDDSVELMQIPDSSHIAAEYGEHSLPKCVKNSIINIRKHEDLDAQKSKLYVSPGTCPDTDKLDYLQPAFVHANIEVESKRESHSYIDVTG